jgi:hypothetical protein
MIPNGHQHRATPKRSRSLRLPYWDGEGERAVAPQAVTWRELRGDIELDIPGATACRILDHKAKRLRILSTVEPAEPGGPPHFHVALLYRAPTGIAEPTPAHVSFLRSALPDVELVEHPNPDGGPSRHFWAPIP